MVRSARPSGAHHEGSVYSRNHVRRLPDRRSGRPRRHGRRLPGDRPVARASGRAQADRARTGRERALPRALPAGAAAGGFARPPQRHPDLRGGRARRAAVSRHALRRGQRPSHCPRAGGEALAGADTRHSRSGRRRPRRRSQARAGPPRRQARQRAPRPGRSRLPDRLRHHQAARGRVDRYRQDGWDARLPGARADPRRPGGRSDGLLRARLRAVRVPGRQAAVPAPYRGGDDVGAHAGAAGAASGPPAARTRARQGAREGQGGPLRELWRADRRRRRGARPPDADGGAPPARPGGSAPARSRDSGCGRPRPGRGRRARDPGRHGRRRCRRPAAREWCCGYRCEEWRGYGVHRVPRDPRERGGGRGCDLGARQRAPDGLAHRSEDQEGHEEIQDGRRPERAGRRRGRDLDR